MKTKMSSVNIQNSFSRVPRLASRAFALMEVNLAIFIMAVGLLARVALHPLAYRESSQSKDDVKAAAAADCVLNALTATLSSRNIKWNDWENKIEDAIGKTAGNAGSGWLAYCEERNHRYIPKKMSTINGTAKSVFSALVGANTDHSPQWPVSGDLACALVAQWGMMPVLNGNRMRWQEDHSRVAISLRVARRSGDLMGQPIFYTEVHFQGDQKDLNE